MPMRCVVSSTDTQETKTRKRKVKKKRFAEDGTREPANGRKKEMEVKESACVN